MELDIVDLQASPPTYQYVWVLGYDRNWRADRCRYANKRGDEGWRIVPGITAPSTDGILVLMERVQPEDSDG